MRFKFGRCILGNAIAKELGVVHIGPRPVSSVTVVIKSRVTLPTSSKLNTLKLKLHVDPNIPPVATKVKEFLLHLKTK